MPVRGWGRQAIAFAGLAASAALMAGLPSPPPADARATQRVVVSTDIGAEYGDQWALAHAALAPELELVGVLTTHAPALAYPGPGTASRHAKEVLATVGRPDVPVLAGLVEPFGGEQDIRPGPAANFLLEAARGHSAARRLRVLVLGAATDVALALVVDPTLADRIEVIATGFDRWPRGGDGGNVKQDPLAWKLLLQSRTPLVVGDAVVAKRDLVLTREQERALVAGRGRAGAYLGGQFEAWLAKDPRHRQAVAGIPDAWPIRDQAAVAWLLGHARAEARPRPRLAPDLTLIHAAGTAAPPIRWITAVDHAALWAAFTTALERKPAR